MNDDTFQIDLSQFLLCCRQFKDLMLKNILNLLKKIIEACKRVNKIKQITFIF